MKVVKDLFDFYINSSIHVAIEVSSLVLISCLQLGISYDLYFLGFVFFGTLTGYNFVKYAGLAKLHHISLTKNLRLIQLFSFICFLSFVFFTFHLPLKTLLGTSIFGLLTIFYALPVFPKKKNLRSFKGLKIFVITLVVSGVTVIVPVIHNEILFDWNFLLVFVQRLFFILAVILPFEIRDLRFDENELGTIPQKMGIVKSKFIGIFLLLGFFIIEIINPASEMPFLASTAAISLISAGFIVFSKKEQSKYFASFWVEAIPIMWLGIIVLFQNIF